MKKKESEMKFSLLFFYGTLKSGFYWNHKFLSRAKKVGDAETVNIYPMVLGDSYVPYLLGDLEGQGNSIKGEVWCVNEDNLQGLDEYEGIGKGYYSRKSIKVRLLNTIKNNPRGLKGKNLEIDADIYFTESNEDLRNRQYQVLYPIGYNNYNYSPIDHILVKQQMYLLDDPLKHN